MPMTANGLAKLLEELGELSQVAAKRLAYFHTSTHPDGAGDLNDRMEKEMADVSAACAFVIQQFCLNGEAIADRAALKLHTFQQWHADPENGRDCFHASRASPIGRDGPTASAASQALRDEIMLVLTDPDSTLSPGAARALQYIDAALAATGSAPTSEGGN